MIPLLMLMMTMTAEPLYGEASWYSVQSVKAEGNSGVTASGELFDEHKLTCALRGRDFGKFYKVTNIGNGKSVVVRHNDYGPAKRLKRRVIDLSPAAFKAIASLDQGIIRVKVEEI